MTLNDGTVYTRGQVRLWSFTQPEHLVKTTNALYAGVSAAAPRAIESFADETLHQYKVATEEVTEDLLTARRAFHFFLQGPIYTTGKQTDLALAGSGFFVVRNPSNDTQRVTRAGTFKIAESGYLVTIGDLRVQGYTDSTLATIGDILIDNSSAPASAEPEATLAHYGIGLDGASVPF